MADILGFSANVTEETLIISRRLLVRPSCSQTSLLIHGSHNQFPPDTPFPKIDVLSDGFTELCAIIAKYNAQSCFRLRLLHHHTKISEGQILLGNNITQPLGYWTRPTAIPDIDLQNIHGHIFSADATSCTRNALLYPSEFREGPPVSVRNIDGKFFKDFTDCLRTKGLENTFGLELIEGQVGKMIEFSFNIGSLLVREEEVKAELREENRRQSMSQETGWVVTVKDGAVYKTGQIYCWTYPPPTGHIKVIDSKANGVSGAVKFLRDEGVLA